MTSTRTTTTHPTSAGEGGATTTTTKTTTYARGIGDGIPFGDVRCSRRSGCRYNSCRRRRGCRCGGSGGGDGNVDRTGGAPPRHSCASSSAHRRHPRRQGQQPRRRMTSLTCTTRRRHRRKANGAVFFSSVWLLLILMFRSTCRLDRANTSGRCLSRVAAPDNEGQQRRLAIAASSGRVGSGFAEAWQQHRQIQPPRHVGGRFLRPSVQSYRRKQHHQQQHQQQPAGGGLLSAGIAWDDNDDESRRILDAMRRKLFGNLTGVANNPTGVRHDDDDDDDDDDDNENPSTISPRLVANRPDDDDDDDNTSRLFPSSSDADDAAFVLNWLVRLGGSSSGSRRSKRHVRTNDDDDNDDYDAASQPPPTTTTTTSGSSAPWISPVTRVRGCVATVHLQTTVQQQHRHRPRTTEADDADRNGDDEARDGNNGLLNDDMVVTIRGNADAMVSRGLLVLVSRLLDHQPAHQVLRLRPDTVTDLLGLRTVLSPGRNDGIASMIRTVQQHLQEYQQQQTRPQLGQQQQMQQQQQQQQQQELYRPLVGDPDSVLYRAQPSAELVSSLDRISDAAASQDPTSISRIIGSATGSKNAGKRVALLLSGGVDSSVALHLLLRDGYDVTCYYLKIWLQDELQHLGTCPWEDDYKVCVAVCQQANVPLRTVSLQNEYHRSVVQHSIREAELGRTPNPDILCNSMVKFGCFLQHLLLEEGEQMKDEPSRGFDYVASGHYAQVERDADTGLARLYRAPDPVKDQSYFLCALDQAQLQRLMFPIGHLQKHQVRELAVQLRLPNRSRPDSQGLCFLGKLKFDDFLANYLGERPGPIVDAGTGDKLGVHRGVWYHTVGQRKGIGRYLHPKATSRGPWYVVAKDPQRDIVYCSNAYDESMYTDARSRVAVENIHWLADAPPPSLVDAAAAADKHLKPTRLLMKVRHGPKLVTGTLDVDEADPSKGDVRLDQVDSGLAPGQYIVFYNGTECLGGGIISERHWIQFVADRHYSSDKIANDTSIFEPEFAR